jgi:glycosyltransferase involved in cell wall biosynthesis
MSSKSQSSVVSGSDRAVAGQRVLPITAVVLTFNEEPNLGVCLESISGWTEALVVVDSGSTDRTTDIARRHGATVLQHPFDSHARQWRWALSQLPLSSDWILALDADQRITPALRYELARCFDAAGPPQLATFDGAYIKRRQIFRGTWIRHGGYYPKYLLKLFRRSKVLIDELDLVDHHFYVNGHVVTLQNDLVEENRKEDDITFWIDKHNRYAARLAEEEQGRERQSAAALIRPSFFGAPDQRILWLKGLWSRLPLYLRPALYFLYRYALRLGFLDGKQGFIFHFMQGFWFRLLVDIKLDEARKRTL